jgi:hypothetical protein
METMDLSDANDSSMMTPIQNAIIPEPEKSRIEKNMNNIEMDSTPLSELMSGPEVYDTNPVSQDPRMMHMAQPQQPKQPMESSFKPKSKPSSKTQYPFNLNEEQMDALIAGVSAIVAFSVSVQEKLANVLPSAFDEAGARTTMGIIVSGVIAAIAYYIIKKFAMPKPQAEQN